MASIGGSIVSREGNAHAEHAHAHFTAGRLKRKLKRKEHSMYKFKYTQIEKETLYHILRYALKDKSPASVLEKNQ
jgi:hypothetical protein